MTIGPVEYVVIEFPGNRFHGDIAPALGDIIDSGVVRIIDLVFVKKSADGKVQVFEYDELDEASSIARLDGEAGGLIGEEDVADVAEVLHPDSSALLVVWEDRWAAPLAAAVRAAGGEIVAGSRIHHEIVAETFAEIPSAP